MVEFAEVRRLFMLEIQAIDVILSFAVIGGLLAFALLTPDWKLDEILGVRRGR